MRHMWKMWEGVGGGVWQGWVKKGRYECGYVYEWENFINITAKGESFKISAVEKRIIQSSSGPYVFILYVLPYIIQRRVFNDRDMLEEGTMAYFIIT